MPSTSKAQLNSGRFPPTKPRLVRPPLPATHAVFDLIERTASRLDGPEFPWHPTDLHAALRSTVLDLEAIHALVPDVLDGDRVAESDFRAWLAYREVPLDFSLEGEDARDAKIRTELGNARRHHTSFLGSEAFVNIFFAAAHIALGQSDWETLSSRIQALFARTEWVEEFYAAAAACERTGVGHAFTRLSWLFAEEIEGAAEHGPAPAPPDPPLPEPSPAGQGGTAPVMMVSKKTAPTGKKKPRKKKPRRKKKKKVGKKPARPPRRRGPPRTSEARRRRALLRALLFLMERYRRWQEQHLPTSPYVWADDIDAITPSQACAGEQVVIHGSGFGDSQPPDVFLLIPTEDGCQRVDVNPGQWSDDEITIAVPDWARDGCVGFLDESIRDEHQRYLNAVAGQARKIGSILAGMGLRYRSPSKPRQVPNLCPPCTGANHLEAGVPVVRSFLLNGQTDTPVEPTETLVLTWEIVNADTFQIRRLGTSGPSLDVTNPAGESLWLGPSNANDLQIHRYQLTANNRCGVVTAEVIARVSVEPELTITGMEVTQGIQHFSRAGKTDNSVELGAGKSTIVRLYARADIGTFNGGEIPGVTAEIGYQHAGQGYWEPPLAADNNPIVLRPDGDLERADETHTFNFSLPTGAVSGSLKFRFRVTVAEFGGRSNVVRRQSSADQKSFSSLKTLKVVRVLYNWNGNTPTAANFYQEMRSIKALTPVAAISFWVPQPTDQIIATPHDLSTDDGLFDAFDDLEDLADDYEDNGEYWVGMSVSFNRGVGWDRRQICYVGNRIKTSHELGHAHKLNHVDIGGAAEPYDSHADGAKVLDVPFDSTNMDVPNDPNAGSGINDLMGYGSPRWISEITWRRFIARRK